MAFWNIYPTVLLGSSWWWRGRPRLSSRVWRVRDGARRWLLYYAVRDLGNGLTQARLPDGSVVVQPSDSLIVNHEIYGACVYDRYRPIRSGDVVLDVGAHVGIFTVRAARKAREGLVVAVEPHPRNFRLLTYNLRLNGLRNVLPFNLALSRSSRPIRLHLAGLSVMHSTALARSGRWLTVEARTMDELVADLGLERVDFVKVDVEGAELDVLMGAVKTLRRHEPFLAVACYHTPGEHITVGRFLSRLGFHVRRREGMIYASKRWEAL